MIFGNVAAIYEFHREWVWSALPTIITFYFFSVFQDLLEKSKGSPETIAQCFLDKVMTHDCHVTVT